MRVDIEPNKNITFKSGYPTFGVNGHLSKQPDVYDCVYVGYKPIPNGLLKGNKIDYFA
jgi:hypothetical protein